MSTIRRDHGLPPVSAHRAGVSLHGDAIAGGVVGINAPAGKDMLTRDHRDLPWGNAEPRHGQASPRDAMDHLALSLHDTVDLCGSICDIGAALDWSMLYPLVSQHLRSPVAQLALDASVPGSPLERTALQRAVDAFPASPAAVVLARVAEVLTIHQDNWVALRLAAVCHLRIGLSAGGDPSHLAEVVELATRSAMASRVRMPREAAVTSLVGAIGALAAGRGDQALAGAASALALCPALAEARYVMARVFALRQDTEAFSRTLGTLLRERPDYSVRALGDPALAQLQEVVRQMDTCLAVRRHKQLMSRLAALNDAITSLHWFDARPLREIERTMADLEAGGGDSLAEVVAREVILDQAFALLHAALIPRREVDLVPELGDLIPCASDPDSGRIALYSHDRRVVVFDWRNRTILRTWYSDKTLSGVLPVRLAPGGRTVATTCTDGCTTVLDVETGQVVSEIRASTGAWFSPDGQWCIATRARAPWSVILDLRTGRPLEGEVAQVGAVHVAFHPFAPVAILWGAGSTRLIGLKAGRVMAVLPPLVDEGAQLAGASLTKVLVHGAREEDPPRLVDVGTGADLGSVPAGFSHQDLVMSPSAQFVIRYRCEDGRRDGADLLEVDPWRPVVSWQFPGDTLTVRFTRDSRYAMVFASRPAHGWKGSEDRCVEIRDLVSGERLRGQPDLPQAVGRFEATRLPELLWREDGRGVWDLGTMSQLHSDAEGAVPLEAGVLTLRAGRSAGSSSRPVLLCAGQAIPRDAWRAWESATARRTRQLEQQRKEAERVRAERFQAERASYWRLSGCCVSCGQSINMIRRLAGRRDVCSACETARR